MTVLTLPTITGSDGRPIAPLRVTAVLVDATGPDYTSQVTRSVDIYSKPVVTLDEPPINMAWQISVRQSASVSTKVVTFAGPAAVLAQLPVIDPATMQPLPPSPEVADWEAVKLALEAFQEPGPQGPQGAQGVAGAVGPAGPVGPIGPAGLHWRSTWSSVTQYAADDAVYWSGSSWFASAAPPVGGVPGTDSTWIPLAAQGGVGPVGPAGAAGATGAQGPQGVAGATGATGSAGTPGTAGAKGDTGAQGVQGVQGTPGATGATGAQGPQGLTGPAGIQGPTGATGPAGAAGAAGATGATGATPLISTTSSTSNSVSTGSKTFTVDAGLAFVAAMSIVIVSRGTPGAQMQATITSYTGTSLVAAVSGSKGTGTFTDWTITVAGVQGVTGATGATGPTGPAGSTARPALALHRSNTDLFVGSTGNTNKEVFPDVTDLNDSTSFYTVGTGTAAGRVTVLNAGVYEIAWNAYFDADGGSGARATYVTKNGTLLAQGASIYTSNTGVRASGHAVVRLSANDVIALWAYASTAGVVRSPNATDCILSIAYIGS